MTESRHPQSRMVPVAVAGLVGVLLGALVVVLGVLAGRAPCCCCNGPACGQSGAASPALSSPAGRGLDHQFVPPPIWLLPQDSERRPVPLPGSLMLVSAGWIAWALRA